MSAQLLNRVLWLAVLALVASSIQACEQATAKDAVRRYFQSMSPKCIEHRDEYSYDEKWLEACKRMSFPPHKHLHAGFAERTTIKSVRIINKDSRTFGIIDYEAPDPFEFQLRLKLVGHCLGEDAKLGPHWPVPPWNTSCGDEFWIDLPIGAQRAGVELICHASDWRVYVPDPKTTGRIAPL